MCRPSLPRGSQHEWAGDRGPLTSPVPAASHSRGARESDVGFIFQWLSGQPSEKRRQRVGADYPGPTDPSQLPRAMGTSPKCQGRP